MIDNGSIYCHLSRKVVHVPLSAYIGTIPARVFDSLVRNDNLL